MAAQADFRLVTIVLANNLGFMTEREGQGAPLIFLGGTGWDLRQRPNPMDSPLVEDFDVLHFDQRGMGRSSKPAGPYTMADFAADAVAIMDEVGWQRAHVVGYSFGGMVAQELAIRSPHKVSSLVLGATTPGGAGGSSYPIDAFLGLDPYERAKRGLEIADLNFTPDWQAANAEVAEQKVLRRVMRQTQYIDEPGTRDALVAQLEARSAHDAYNRLDRIEAPTLVLAGDADGQAPMEAQQRMADRIPNCELKVLAGSHNFIVENDEAYRLIRDFCLGQQ